MSICTEGRELNPIAVTAASPQDIEPLNGTGQRGPLHCIKSYEINALGLVKIRV
jgi:hypothetical protein